MPINRSSIDFAVQSKEYKAKQLNAQTCKNWYGISDPDGEFKNVLFPFPGSLLWSDDAGVHKNVRGMYSLNSVFYGVVDDEFRIYNDNGDWIKKGNLNTSVGLVKFMANDNQIFVTDFQNGYVYQLVTTASRTKGDFFKITNASSFIGTPTFAGSGINDMRALGTYTGSNNRTYRVEIDGQSQSSVSTATFSGSGLNDAHSGGSFTGIIQRNFRIQIDSTATPNTFQWSKDNVTWDAHGVPITGSAIVLTEGVTIRFDSTTGHTLGDNWFFGATPAGVADTFKWSNDGGSSFVAQNIQITGADQLLDDGVQVVFAHTSGHTKPDYWDFNVTIDSAFFPPIIPIYLDSYGIFPKSNTQRFYLSSSEDFSAINALDYANTNAFPDNIVCGVALNEEIVMIGVFTTELWYDTGASPFPLQRRPNLLINWGTSAPFSLAWDADNTLYWLGQSITGGRVVVQMANYNVQVISDQALNDKLQEYSYVDDAIGFVVEFSGRKFFFLTIPSADVTWVWDIDAKAWRQRTTLRALDSIQSQDYVEGRYLANCHVYHNNEHYIGDYRSGKIYKMSNTYYLDGGMTIINEAVTPPLHNNLNRMSVYSFEPVLQAATALDSGQGSDPTVMLQYSRDGGYTWSKELWASLGKVGEMLNRCKYNKLSYGRGIIFKIRISDPVFKVLMGAIIELEDTGS